MQSHISYYRQFSKACCSVWITEDTVVNLTNIQLSIAAAVTVYLTVLRFLFLTVGAGADWDDMTCHDISKVVDQVGR